MHDPRCGIRNSRYLVSRDSISRISDLAIRISLCFVLNYSAQSTAKPLPSWNGYWGILDMNLVFLDAAHAHPSVSVTSKDPLFLRQLTRGLAPHHAGPPGKLLGPIGISFFDIAPPVQ